MDESSYLQYENSLSLLEDGDPTFRPQWPSDEQSSYDLDERAVGCNVLCPTHEVLMTADRLDSDGHRTVITESMSVTASDEEKLQLLNKNTELRRLNKELMKLNQQWDEIYRRTTENLQHTVRALQQEVQSLRHHVDKLSVKLEHEQNKREFYENSLLQEMKQNQKLQEYVRHLENSLHYKTLPEKRMHSATDISKAHNQPNMIPNITMRPHNSKETTTRDQNEKDKTTPKSEENSLGHQNSVKMSRCTQHMREGTMGTCENEQDMNKLKEQLKALKCQTEIYAADYKTEHTDRERMRSENEKLKKKERDMREQMLLLQEQLKIYEDDFRKERSDKQVLQRLLKGRTSAQEPVLVHRCNNIGHRRSSAEASELPARFSREQRGINEER
ncbi:optineurin [Bombina bombina]|uniref:optineurin n=1 Tax=Bombina bombina TaxID=8345 RepID=UPI00235B0AD2|nr:optineurin [Bombina bombina]